VQHYVPYVHTQNDLDESLVKRIKLITRPLLYNCNLPISCWDHAVLHAACRGLISRVPRVTGYGPIIQIQLVPTSSKWLGNHTACIGYDPSTPG
jgi:hypothetical protein